MRVRHSDGGRLFVLRGRWWWVMGKWVLILGRKAQPVLVVPRVRSHGEMFWIWTISAHKDTGMRTASARDSRWDVGTLRFCEHSNLSTMPWLYKNGIILHGGWDVSPHRSRRRLQVGRHRQIRGEIFSQIVVTHLREGRTCRTTWASQ